MQKFYKYRYLCCSDLYNYNIDLAVFVTAHLAVVETPAEPGNEAGYTGVLSGAKAVDPSSSLVENQAKNNHTDCVIDVVDNKGVLGKKPGRYSGDQK